MKIAALSDMHGILPNPTAIDTSDMFIVAGDIFPLSIQRNVNMCMEWYFSVFLEWANVLPVDKMIVIAGNHDFFFENFYPSAINSMYQNYSAMPDKVVYLQDETYEFNGLKIYGTPWCENLRNWAFFASNTLDKYKNIPKELDILVTHQPPRIHTLGCSNIGTAWEDNFGSQNLADVIEQSKIKNVICGHVHSGLHGGYEHNGTMIYNVSYVNEKYLVEYPVTYFKI